MGAGNPPSSRLRTSRPRGRIGWTAALAVALVALLTGWAVASTTLPRSSQNAEGNYVVVGGSVVGVVAHAVLFSTVPAPAPSTASRNHLILTVLALRTTAGHLDRYCAGTCRAGHFGQALEYVLGAQPTAEGFQMSVSSGAGATRVATTLYFELPATVLGATAAMLVVYVDLGTVGFSTSATVAIQQCSSATHCP